MAALVSQPLSDQLIRDLSKAYGYEPAALRAIISVETGGIGTDPHTGKLLIQFEPAWFSKLLPKILTATASQPAQAANWQLIRANKVEGQVAERAAFNAAWAIHPKTAMLATSWGLGQIMGHHYARVGYPTVDAMVDAFKAGGEAEQFKAIVKFFYTDAKLSAALKELNWAGVAYRYNGSNYKVNAYDIKLEQAYNKFKGKI
jgi:hypothetical protein